MLLVGLRWRNSLRGASRSGTRLPMGFGFVPIRNLLTAGAGVMLGSVSCGGCGLGFRGFDQLKFDISHSLRATEHKRVHQPE